MICFAVVSGNLKINVSNIVINNKEIGLLFVAVTRRESSCFKTLVSRMKINQSYNKGETDVTACLTDTD